MDNISKLPSIYLRPSIHFKASFGDSLVLSGNAPFLNNWDEANFIHLFWKSDNIWENLIEISSSSLQNKLEYKYILKDGSILYESSQNRTLDLSDLVIFDNNMEAIIINLEDKWEDISQTKIKIERILKNNDSDKKGIVVLGKGLLKNGLLPQVLINRMKKVKELSLVKKFGLAVLTGADVKKVGKTEAEVMEDLAREHEIADLAFIQENEAKNTIENAYFSKLILLQKNCFDFCIITSEYHMERSLLIFSRIFGEKYKIEGFISEKQETLDEATKKKEEEKEKRALFLLNVMLREYKF